MKKMLYFVLATMLLITPIDLVMAKDEEPIIEPGDNSGDEEEVVVEPDDNPNDQDKEHGFTIMAVEDNVPADKNETTYNCDEYPGYTLNGDKCEFNECTDRIEEPQEMYVEEEVTEMVNEEYVCGEKVENGVLVQEVCVRQVPRTTTIGHMEYDCDHLVGYRLENGKCVSTICTEDEQPASENPETYNCDRYEGYTLSGDLCTKEEIDEVSQKIEITNIDLIDRSDETEVVEKPTVTGLDIKFELSFASVNNYAKYKIKYKNSSNSDFTLSDKNEFENEYLKYEIKFEDDSNIIKANSEKNVEITITYKSEAPVSALVGGKFVGNNNLRINATENVKNPATSDDIMFYAKLLIASMALCGVAIITKKAKN